MTRTLPLHTARLLAGLLLLAPLAGCRTGRPDVDERYQTLMVRGGKAHEAGLPGTAQQHYRSALERAWAIGSPTDAADAAYNLSLTAIELGQNETAALYAALAIASAEQVREHPPWELLLLRAKLDLALERIDEARIMSARASEAAQRADRHARAEVRLFQVRLDKQTGRFPEAEATLAVLLNERLRPDLRALATELRARLMMQREQAGEAARLFAEAAELSRSEAHPHHMATCLFEAARAYEQAERPLQAADYYMRAATAWYGQRAWPRALRAIEQTLALETMQDIQRFQNHAQDLLLLIHQQTAVIKEETP